MRIGLFGACLFMSFFALVASAQQPPAAHPDTRGPGWSPLFKSDISDAIFPTGIWTFSDGILTATADQTIFSAKPFDNFILDLEFRNAKGTNSGVFVHVSDMKEYIPNSVEVQICDDFDPEWGNAPPYWRCAAIFGHQPAKKAMVKQPGEWNHYTITCIGKKIWVLLNGLLVNECDLGQFSSAQTNPDGSQVPKWLSKPPADLPMHGYIGLQGKHAGSPIFFRNIMIKEI